MSQVVTTNKAVKPASFDPQQCRRLTLVALGSGQCLRDETALGGFERNDAEHRFPRGVFTRHRLTVDSGEGGSPQVIGQVAGLDNRVAGHDIRVFDGIDQLADIAAPSGLAQRVHRLVGHPAWWFFVEFGDALQVMIHQHGDIIAAITQRWHIELHYVEPEKQVQTKRAMFNHLAQVTVGGGQNANIDGDGADGADRGNGGLLEKTEQACLVGGFEFTNLVEKKGAAIGGADEAEGFTVGTGERPPRMTEHL